MKDKDFNSHTSILKFIYNIFSFLHGGYSLSILFCKSILCTFCLLHHAIVTQFSYTNLTEEDCVTIPKESVRIYSIRIYFKQSVNLNEAVLDKKKHSRKHSLSRSFKRTETQQTSFVWLCDWIYSGCDQLIRILWSSNNSLIHIFEGSTDTKWNNYLTAWLPGSLSFSWDRHGSFSKPESSN